MGLVDMVKYIAICVDGRGQIVNSDNAGEVNIKIYTHYQEYPNHRIHNYVDGRRINP
jgi:hypothetical protein